jgi:hypothetical protein
MWTDNQIKLLIKERRENNEYYWDFVGNGKMNFWDGVRALNGSGRVGSTG